MARLCVLYEDLRIETFACAAESIPVLDILDPIEEADQERISIGRYRRNYFLRRSIATLEEFIDALDNLKHDREFKQIRGKLPADAEELLANALNSLQKNRALIKKIRNDVGGHFGAQAASYAVRNIREDAIGKLEWKEEFKGDRADFRLRFAGELAATAMIRHFSKDDTSEEISRMIRTCAECYGYAATCVHALIATVIYPRFA